MGAEVHSVAYVARQLGVAWHTVMDAVRYWGHALVTDPARVGVTKAAGVDETKFLVAKRTEPTKWASAICDVDRRMVVDVIEGRQGPDLDAWLARQPERWRGGVEVTVTDLHEPFRQALAARLPNATPVADPFHVVGVGTRVVERTRRRVQQETLAWHTTGHTNGPVEGRNSLIKNIKRVAAGPSPTTAQDPARLRRLQLGTPRHPTPLKREAPDIARFPHVWSAVSWRVQIRAGTDP